MILAPCSVYLFRKGVEEIHDLFPSILRNKNITGWLLDVIGVRRKLYVLIHFGNWNSSKK